MNNTTATICAPATPLGGAIAIIRISGPQTFPCVAALFSRPVTQFQPRTAHFLTLRLPDGQPLDEVLLTLFPAPHSYTGEDSAEISCHGSSYIARQILQLLTAQGCRIAQPGEFTQRAFLAGKMDLTQAEAVADLIAATSADQHRAAFSQLRGSTHSALATLHSQLLQLTTLLELELDFSDHDDVQFAPQADILALTRQAARHLQALIDSYATGQALRHGIPVAIVGAPNVGKSTLLNRLVGEERAIVSPQQGTTRDIVDATAVIDGHTFRFLDTAGLRHTADPIEALGQQRSLQAAERARIIILLTEPGVPCPTLNVRPDQTIIQRTNKTPEFSALDGTGIPALCEQLAQAAPAQATSDAIITNSRQHAHLTQAHEALLRVENALSLGLSTDLVAEDLRQALHHLGQVTGTTITAQDTLANIFSHFCIGK